MKLQYFRDTDTVYLEFKSSDIIDNRELDGNTLLESAGVTLYLGYPEYQEHSYGYSNGNKILYARRVLDIRREGGRQA
ncbi:MAG: DUF2283 domain-containing protein [Symploca sp. SIO1A3]|nr:DUF2283 domain-containing protein [Symploca sp. SIO1A3]